MSAVSNTPRSTLHLQVCLEKDRKKRKDILEIKSDHLQIEGYYIKSGKSAEITQISRKGFCLLPGTNPLALAQLPMKIKASKNPFKPNKIALSLLKDGPSQVNSYLHIKGQVNQDFYSLKIALSPFKIEGWVQEEGSKASLPATVIWDQFERKELLSKFDSYSPQVEVTLEKEDDKFNIILSPSEQEFTLRSTYIISHLDAITIENTADLAQAIKEENPDPTLKRIAEAVVEQYRSVAADYPRTTELRDLFNVLKAVGGESRRIICEMIGGSYSRNVFNSQALLEILEKIFIQFQEGLRSKAIKVANSQDGTPDPAELVNIFNADDLVRIMDPLVTKLQGIQRQDSTRFLVATHLAALVALLELMMVVDVHGVHRKQHEKYYAILASFRDDSDAEVAYLAEFSVQAFIRIPNDEPMANAFGRRTWHVIKGLIHLADGISLFEPWHIAPALNALPEFKAAFQMNTFQRDWFVYLSVLRHLFLKVDPKFVIAFQKDLQRVFQALPDKIDKHNPFFVIGFARLLWELLRNPSLEASVHKSALELLNQIREMNQPGRRDILTMSSDHYAASLREHISNRIYATQQHPDESIRELACEMVSASGLKPTKDFINPFALQLHPSRIFEKARDSAFVLYRSFKQMKTSLAENGQVHDESPYFIMPLAKDTQGIAPAQLLTEKIETFLKSTGENVLVVRGDPGVGKSLSSKFISLQQWKSYSSGKWVFVHVAFSRLSEPIKNAVRETLNRFHIDSSEKEEELGNCNVAWFFDGADELDYRNERGVERLVNLFETNGLAQRQKDKFIFVTRLNFNNGKDNVFQPSNGKLKSITINPFTENQAYTYLKNYVDVKKERGQPVLWKYKRYQRALEALKVQGMLSLIENQFLLRITADVLPIIVNIKKRPGNAEITLDEIFEKSLDEIFEKLGPKFEIKLLDVFASVNEERSRRRGARVPGKPIIKTGDCILFSILFAYAKMKTSSKWIEISDQKIEHKEYFGILVEGRKDNCPYPEYAELQEQINGYYDALFKDIHEDDFAAYLDLLKNSCLVCHEGKWDFMHERYNDYFLFVARTNRLDKLKKLIANDIAAMRNLND